ncbi:MAG TPA: outer membrane protein assembly factor BamE [Limnobacter sp.]|uniref:L,D-transpeptidase Cds6 family protein n=1 Tax=Limnobacter sp. TaxID=2003368 RepID=UPI002ED80840
MSTFDHLRASRLLSTLGLVLSVTTLAACGSIKSLKDVPEYLDSEFENVGPRDFITKVDLARVKLGMSPLQVKNKIGAPMLSNTEDQSRWDYVVKQGEGAGDEYVPYGVYFKDDKVVRVAALEKPPASTVKTDAAAAPAAAPAEAVPAADLLASDPAPAASADVGDGAAIADMLSNWAAAWSSKDVAGYMGFYADSFKPSKMTRSAWEKQRKQRLSAPETISVTLSDIQVKMTSDSMATVSFKQEYASNKFKDVGHKTLKLVKSAGGWKIEREEFSK